MGGALAQLHAVLAGFPAGRAPRAPAPPSVDETLRGIERLLDRPSGAPDPGDHERWAEERLRSRAAWLRRAPAAADPVVGDEQLVHGDYQDANLFFEGGAVSSIIDWDQAEVRSAAGEVVRALHLSLPPTGRGPRCPTACLTPLRLPTGTGGPETRGCRRRSGSPATTGPAASWPRAGSCRSPTGGRCCAADAVELVGIEPTASSMPWTRSTN